MYVNEKIIAGRRKLGLTSSQLAEMIDVNQGTIIRYENGTIKMIPTEKLRKLADVLEYTFEDFIEGDPKYQMLSDKVSTQCSLSKEDELLLKWFHRLPCEYREIVNKLTSIE